jgi:UDP-N-acetylmuramoyl-L-alanyl-D-glutamate--2,6-diaminopimelate ligase
MKLDNLLQPWVNTNVQCDVSGIQHDSRKVQPGDVFLAYPGAVSDGRQFMSQAIQAGAVAIIYEPHDAPVFESTVPCIALPNLTQQLGQLASRFYGDPSQALRVFGVTGTNGKTTIAYQLMQAYTLLAQSSAYIGTLGVGTVHTLQPLHNTTPDALVLQQLLATMRELGTQVVCMEVSSHALAQGRVAGIDFKQAIFTNLTLDHLDYHHTMQAYAEAKAKLFTTPSLQHAIINGDDDQAALMQAGIPAHTRCWRYGLHAHNLDVRAMSLKMDMQGTQFMLHSPWGEFAIQTRSLGEFNVYNSLAVWTALVTNGVAVADAVAIMPQLLPSPGRMEIVHQAPTVIVDYAHTPDALENVLMTLTALKRARLIVVFGCGGDRDKSKRPIMGEMACRIADQVILTNDNPRTEDPDAIRMDIQAGMSDASNVTVCLDRKQAIQLALQSAGVNDLVLIAGKGHENYQEIGHTRFDFSDQAVILDCYDHSS